MNNPFKIDIIFMNHKTNTMLRYAIIFFIIALVSGLLGASGIAGLSMNIAYIVGVIGIVLFVIHLITGRARA